jgi:hypothetical protein
MLLKDAQDGNVGTAGAQNLTYRMQQERDTPLRKIAELNMLVRAQAELPDDLSLATEEFREDWKFVKSANARQLQKKIQARGWNFIKSDDGSLRSGVGDTSQEAIAGALKLALRRVSNHCNAVEVEHIELTQYPWFFLARVRVYPYRIQQRAVLPVADEAMQATAAPRRRILSPNAPALYPHFGSAMPQLKQMLVSTRSSEARPQ